MTKYITPTSYGILDPHSQETNDCAVRAFANAFPVTYSEAHEIFAHCGRKDREATNTKTVIEIFTKHCKKVVGTFGTTAFAEYGTHVLKCRNYSGMTLEKFLKHFPTKKYVVLVRGHVFVVDNGQVIDGTYNKANKRITVVWEV